jgi:hypothetical protein
LPSAFESAYRKCSRLGPTGGDGLLAVIVLLVITTPRKKSAVLKLLKKISARPNVIFKPADLHDFKSPLAGGYWPAQLDRFIEPAGSLEEGVGQIERERRAVALLPDLEIIEEPPDVGEEQIADHRVPCGAEARSS